MTSGGAAARENRRHRIGAEERPLAAPRHDRGGRVAEREPDHAGCRDRLEQDAERAAMVAVGDAGKAGSLFACALYRLPNRIFARFETEPVAGVDQARGRFLVDDLRHRSAVRAA